MLFYLSPHSPRPGHAPPSNRAPLALSPKCFRTRGTGKGRASPPVDVSYPVGLRPSNGPYMPLLLSVPPPSATNYKSRFTRMLMFFLFILFLFAGITTSLAPQLFLAPSPTPFKKTSP